MKTDFQLRQFCIIFSLGVWILFVTHVEGYPNNPEERGSISSEKEFVRYFGNDKTPIVWSALSSYDPQKLMDICNNVKWDRYYDYTVDNAYSERGYLLFRNVEHQSRPINVIKCGIANTKRYPAGKHYFSLTKGRRENCYYLLFNFEDDKFYVDKHICE